MVALTLYTTHGAVEYTVQKTVDNYVETLTAALENGNITTVTTAEGSSLVIVPLNVTAIEIRDLKDEE